MMDVAKRLGIPPLQTEGSEARERIGTAEMTPEDRLHERAAEKDFILESEPVNDNGTLYGIN